MARCPNVNTAEYKALQEVYKTEIETNSIINSWQNANESDNFPTVVEAAGYPGSVSPYSGCPVSHSVWQWLHWPRLRCLPVAGCSSPFQCALEHVGE